MEKVEIKVQWADKRTLWVSHLQEALHIAAKDAQVIAISTRLQNGELIFLRRRLNALGESDWILSPFQGKN